LDFWNWNILFHYYLTKWLSGWKLKEAVEAWGLLGGLRLKSGISFHFSFHSVKFKCQSKSKAPKPQSVPVPVRIVNNNLRSLETWRVLEAVESLKFETRDRDEGRVGVWEMWALRFMFYVIMYDRWCMALIRVRTGRLESRLKTDRSWER
jgi:hypothetical protein